MDGALAIHIRAVWLCLQAARLLANEVSRMNWKVKKTCQEKSAGAWLISFRHQQVLKPQRLKLFHRKANYGSEMQPLS